MSSPALEYARQNQPRFLAELKDLLRIPSVSTLPQHKSDIERAADFLAAQMRSIGLEHVEVIKTAGHPLVYADWLHATGKPTALCYGHYDVQPPDPLNLPSGCAFHPRCPFAIARCSVEAPALATVGDKHLAACWVDVRG